MPAPISFRFAATGALLIGTLLAGSLTERRISEALAFPLASINPEIEGWRAIGDRDVPAPTLRALKATSYLSRRYAKDGKNLDLFVAFYAQQRAGESMHSPKHCLPGAGWEIWRLGSATVPAGGRRFEVNKYSIQNAGNRQVMFYWYQSKDRIIASEYLGKVLLARDTILTGRTAGSIVRIMLPDTPSAADEGVAIASQVIPEVWRCFGRGR